MESEFFGHCKLDRSLFVSMRARNTACLAFSVSSFGDLGRSWCSKRVRDPKNVSRTQTNTGRMQCDVLTTLPFCFSWIKKFLGQQSKIWDDSSVEKLFRQPLENLQHRWSNNLRKNLNKLCCATGYWLPHSLFKFACPPCMPPAMYAPCHAHTPAMHTPLPCMPPAMHTPHHTCPPAMHAALPHMPPAMHTPCHAHPLPCMPRAMHTPPAMYTPLPCTPPTMHAPYHSHHPPPPRGQTETCKNITFANFVWGR